MPIFLAALSDPLTALIAIVALLLGVWLIVRGPRSERQPGAADGAAAGPAPQAGAAAAPAGAPGKPAARATTFRHGAIKLGSAAAPVPPKSPAGSVPPKPPAASAPPKPPASPKPADAPESADPSPAQPADPGGDVAGEPGSSGPVTHGPIRFRK